MKIGIIVAMQKELKQLAQLLSDTHEERHAHHDFLVGTIGQHHIVVEQCGIGKVNSAVGAAVLIEHFQPELLISTGVAGGADTSLSPKDVVIATECRYHDVYCGSDCAKGQFSGYPEAYPCAAALVEKALHLGGDVRVVAGLTVTGDWFVDSKEKIREILHDFPEAKAVDMESCSIAHTAHTFGVPFLSFRIISDVPLNDTNASQYFNFWEEIANDSFDVTRRFLETI